MSYANKAVIKYKKHLLVEGKMQKQKFEKQSFIMRIFFQFKNNKALTEGHTTDA